MKTAVKRVKAPAFQRVRLSCLADNLVKSGNLERYYDLLADFNFISEKINYPGFGVQALIEDYELIEKNLIDDQQLLNHPEYNLDKIKILKLIQGALRLSAHIISEDKTQLPGQLLGRLLSFEYPEIQLLLEQAKGSKNFLWFRPLIASLTPPGGALLRTFIGHSDWIRAVAISRDGKRVISASYDKTLKLWDLETNSELCTLFGHSGSIYAVAISGDGKQAISASYDKTLKLWDLDSHSELHTFSGHSYSVNAVAISSNGKRAISGSVDETLKLWNLETREKLDTFRSNSHWVRAVAMSGDGKLAISAYSDNSLKLWNLETREKLDTFTGHRGWINAVSMSRDGKRAISASGDNTLKLWNLETGKELRTFIAHNGWVNSVIITADGKRAISASRDRTLKLWNLETGELVATFTAEGNIYCCAIASNGLVVAGEVSGRLHFLSLEGMIDNL